MSENSAVQRPQATRVRFSTLIYFGMAGFGTATVSGIYSAMLTIFYQDYLGLAARWMNIAFFIYALWNAINDPIFGQITDKTRSRWGRRIPYMRFTAPFLGLTFVLVWFAPEKGSDISKFTWMLVTMLLYDTCYTIIGLVHSALQAELTESDYERGKLSISASIFGLVGTLVGFLIPDFFRPKEGSLDVSLLSLRLSMVAVGILIAFLIILATFKLKEHREYSQVDKALPWVPAFKYTFTSKSFLVFVSTNFMCTFMFSICMGSIFYLADYVTRSGTIPLLASLFIPLAVGVPLTQLVLRKHDAVVVMRIYLVITAIGLISLGFLPADLIMIGMGLVGFGYSGVQVVTYLLLGQVIDEDEVRTGVRREGSYLGTNALITKPAQSLANGLIANVLALTHFVTRESNAGVIFLNQPESALFGIRALVGLIPGVALLIAAGLLHWYPITGDRLKTIKTTILDMHALKKQTLAQQTGAEEVL